MNEPMFLLNGARMKLSFQQEECESCGSSSAHFRTIPMDQYAEELQGKWVALVPAENDRHLDLLKLKQQRDDLLAALKDLRIRYETVFGLYAKYAYHESNPQPDLDLALATSSEAIANAEKQP